MDHYSILDHSPSSLAAQGNVLVATTSETSSVSARIANTHPPRPAAPEPRFPGEDAGHSLAEMAQCDLDAALQLLTDRAQYITGASGAAIALRRGQHNDMLCRASAGSNAPELGALLSMDYGLSGECVRTRQLLRCDDAERDPRVNYEVCHELGIASVVVMPILSGEQVLGVFEILSGKPRAFDERDLSALLRLSGMVETAVKHAVAGQIAPPLPPPPVAEIEPEVEVTTVEAPKPEPQFAAPNPAPAPAASVSPELPPKEVTPVKPEETSPTPKKPLFWSAAVRAQSSAAPQPGAESIAVPPVLRNLQKCQACGFPVSQGRAFCVECEERQWRGQRLPHPAISAQKDVTPPPPTPSPTNSKNFTGLADALRSISQDSSPLPPPSKIAEAKIPELKTQELRTEELRTDEPKTVAPPAAPLPISATISLLSPERDAIITATEPAQVRASDNSAPFLSSALQSQSWFASNKYILGALLLVAIVIAAVALLR